MTQNNKIMIYSKRKIRKIDKYIQYEKGRKYKMLEARR